MSDCNICLEKFKPEDEKLNCPQCSFVMCKSCFIPLISKRIDEKLDIVHIHCPVCAVKINNDWYMNELSRLFVHPLKNGDVSSFQQKMLELTLKNLCEVNNCRICEEEKNKINLKDNIRSAVSELFILLTSDHDISSYIEILGSNTVYSFYDPEETMLENPSFFYTLPPVHKSKLQNIETLYWYTEFIYGCYNLSSNFKKFCLKVDIHASNSNFRKEICYAVSCMINTLKTDDSTRLFIEFNATKARLYIHLNESHYRELTPTPYYVSTDEINSVDCVIKYSNLLYYNYIHTDLRKFSFQRVIE